MMNLSIFQQKISALLPNLKLYFNENLSRYTSFRIGGPAEVVAIPKSKEELCEIFEVSALLDIKPVILGAGTNVLAPDAGLPGLIICTRGLDGLQRLDNDRIQVAAGVSMARAATFAANEGLSGLEFAHGIPGSVGGGVYMNAGAYGGEIAQVCESVDVLRRGNKIVTLSAEEMNFSYRHSALEDSGDIVLSAVFQLQKKEPDTIRTCMQELMERRRASQPLNLPSAGSAFKRPTGGYAAALIDEAGLKGYRVGDAAISEKHAGFAVNLGNATAADVRQLLVNVAQIVFEKSGIRLEPEVRIW